MSEQLKAYLIDVLSAIEEIESITKDLTYKEFSKNIITIRAVVKDFAIIGEAAKKIPAITQRKHNQVPLKQTAGIRNKAIPDYCYTKPDVLWDAVKLDLPTLKSKIEEFLDDFG